MVISMFSQRYPAQIGKYAQKRSPRFDSFQFTRTSSKCFAGTLLVDLMKSVVQCDKTMILRHQCLSVALPRLRWFRRAVLSKLGGQRLKLLRCYLFAIRRGCLRRTPSAPLALIWQWVKTNGIFFGVGAPPILVQFRGDWDVHWGYGILTHGHIQCRLGQARQCLALAA